MYPSLCPLFSSLSPLQLLSVLASPFTCSQSAYLSAHNASVYSFLFVLCLSACPECSYVFVSISLPARLSVSLHVGIVYVCPRRGCLCPCFFVLRCLPGLGAAMSLSLCPPVCLSVPVSVRVSPPPPLLHRLITRATVTR